MLLVSGPAWAYPEAWHTRVGVCLEKRTAWRNGPRVRGMSIYVFVDADCPYCHTLWRTPQPYQRTGLQVRNILVGVISASSPGKAAAVINARDPAAAWRRIEDRGGGRSDGVGDIAPVTHIDAADKALLANNLALMHGFGIVGAPAWRTSTRSIKPT